MSKHKSEKALQKINKALKHHPDTAALLLAQYEDNAKLISLLSPKSIPTLWQAGVEQLKHNVLLDDEQRAALILALRSMLLTPNSLSQLNDEALLSAASVAALTSYICLGLIHNHDDFLSENDFVALNNTSVDTLQAHFGDKIGRCTSLPVKALKDFVVVNCDAPNITMELTYAHHDRFEIEATIAKHYPELRKTIADSWVEAKMLPQSQMAKDLLKRHAKALAKQYPEFLAVLDAARPQEQEEPKSENPFAGAVTCLSGAVITALPYLEAGAVLGAGAAVPIGLAAGGVYFAGRAFMGESKRKSAERPTLVAARSRHFDR